MSLGDGYCCFGDVLTVQTVNIQGKEKDPMLVLYNTIIYNHVG